MLYSARLALYNGYWKSVNNVSNRPFSVTDLSNWPEQPKNNTWGMGIITPGLLPWDWSVISFKQPRMLWMTIISYIINDWLKELSWWLQSGKSLFAGGLIYNAAHLTGPGTQDDVLPIWRQHIDHKPFPNSVQTCIAWRHLVSLFNVLRHMASYDLPIIYYAFFFSSQDM